MKHALFIQRAAIFSPSLQDKDAAILRAVEEEMKKVNNKQQKIDKNTFRRLFG